jgi:REP element-mobilizing transposase RayT
MANTYTQIYIQAVFAVQNRLSLLRKEWRDDLFKYITGIVTNQGYKLIIINGVANHVHMFVGMKPVQSLSDLMQDVKGDSSKWINKNRLVKGKFEWQPGYGAFSYSLSQIDHVCRYIANQEEHHRKRTFTEEYKELLKDFGIDFDDKYIFKDIV